MKESLLRQRFDAPALLTWHCRIITPMFLGDTAQQAALRPEPFKGLLRYWWRVAAGRNFSTWQELLEAENKIFGGGGDQARKSLVTVAVAGTPRLGTSSALPPAKEVFHPEVGARGRRINPLLYLGYGPIIWKKGKALYNRPYLGPNETFSLSFRFPKNCLQDETFKLALLYLRAFGAAGSRSRNGWGSFQVEKSEPCELKPAKIPCLKFQTDLFADKDYPHTLALDPRQKQKKALLWRTKNFRQSWYEVLKDLAEIYISIRTSLPPDKKNDLDERHLLGFPLTNHYAFDAPNWGKNARHASPLRFLVRQKKEGYCGFVLHLPFGLSRRMRKNASGSVFFTPKRQFEIWQKVHQHLDHAMQRASINECL